MAQRLGGRHRSCTARCVRAAVQDWMHAVWLCGFFFHIVCPLIFTLPFAEPSQRRGASWLQGVTPPGHFFVARFDSARRREELCVLCLIAIFLYAVFLSDTIFCLCLNSYFHTRSPPPKLILPTWDIGHTPGDCHLLGGCPPCATQAIVTPQTVVPPRGTLGLPTGCWQPETPCAATR